MSSLGTAIATMNKVCVRCIVLWWGSRLVWLCRSGMCLLACLCISTIDVHVHVHLYVNVHAISCVHLNDYVHGYASVSVSVSARGY